MSDDQIDYRWQMLQMRLFEKRISEAFVFFRRQNIEPILIKGWAAARFYPESRRRHFGDIDLLIAPERFTDAVTILGDFKNKHLIDLHCGARHLDRLPFGELFAASETVRCDETDVRILRPEDHLRVLCVHWLTDGGEFREKLWDVYYAVENRPADFDWDRCLNAAGETRRKWVICTIGLAHKYFGLKLENTPIANKIGEIPSWLINTVEREWKSDLRLTPLHACIYNKKEFYRQIKKRFPPNPVQATVEMEGEFDERPRIGYQIGSIFCRLAPSVKRIAKTFLDKHQP